MADAAGTVHPHASPRYGLAAAFAHPRAMAIACIVALTGLGWLFLAAMVAGALANGAAGGLGPGMGLVDLLTGPAQSDPLAAALVAALCQPSIGGTVAGHSLVLPMWAAMTLAMMLPTASAMILTYADIADTAAAKGEPIVPPWVLVGGYAAVWIGFALVATAGQGLLTGVALLDTGMVSNSALFSGAIFVAAGAYQFSPLKRACLTQCQRPLPFFFANWSTTHDGVFRLGVRQGLFCLGCCWAMMLVMFAVGVMNIVWMAALGVIMTVEKLTSGVRFARAVGVALSAIGIALVAAGIIEHWPTAAA